MGLAQELKDALLNQIADAMAAPSTRWEKVELEQAELDGVDHFTGTGHPTWIFQLLVSKAIGVADGTAINVKQGLVVRFSPGLATQAEALARKAVP